MLGEFLSEDTDVGCYQFRGGKGPPSQGLWRCWYLAGTPTDRRAPEDEMHHRAQATISSRFDPICFKIFRPFSHS